MSQAGSLREDGLLVGCAGWFGLIECVGGSDFFRAGSTRMASRLGQAN